MTKYLIWMGIIFMTVMTVIPEQKLSADVSQLGEQPSDIASYENTLRIGWHQKPDPFNPLLLTDTIAMPFLDLIFSRLVQMRSDGIIVPSVAAEWSISDDQKIYTFRLRDNIKFHDGTKMTSKDVMESFKSFSNENVSRHYAEYFKHVKEYRAPEDEIFEIELSEPYAPFMIAVWQVWILPSEKIQEGGHLKSNFQDHPIGSGSHMFYSDAEDGSFCLKSNEDYFEAAPSHDYVCLLINETKQKVWSEFMRGNLDLIFYMDHRNYQEIRSNEEVQTFKSLPNGGYVLTFNMDDEHLSKQAVRQAISMAIDTEEINRRVAEEEAVLIQGPFHPASWVHQGAKDKEHVYDPIRARDILHKQGYQEKDGVLTFDGKPLRIHIYVHEKDSQLLRIIKVLRQQLQEIGIMAMPKKYADHSEFMNDLINNRNTFQGHIGMFSAEYDPSTASRYWMSSAVGNYGNYQNHIVDGYFSQALTTTDQNERKTLYQKIDYTLFEEKPAVFLYIPYAFHAASKEIINAEKLAGSYLPFYEIKSLIKTNKSNQERG